MVEAHYPAIPLKGGERTVAIVAKEMPKRLVVFVHGFRGEALATWNDFPLLVRKDPDLADTDFVFYGYDSVGTRATTLAGQLARFLADISHPTKHRRYPMRNAIGTQAAYGSILLVCHSLGAIVARRAMLIAHDSSPRAEWVDRSGLLLFAPAHTGASAVRLLNELPGYSKLIALLARQRMPVLEDLSEGCMTLQDLLDDSRRVLRNGHAFVKAKLVVNAGTERVVNDHRFLEDALPFEVVTRKNHSTVCKPNGRYYPEPLEFLKRVL